ncbi:hypothetical protein B0H10DRAFT_1944591 [Mycena sp. CBHHK59/15]|nr:hypothetical protein B0H10DRAFT_1944591 [Mycena sp. CBHHK59/15]
MADSPSDTELIFRCLEPDDDGHNLFDRLTTKEKLKKWIYITKPSGSLFTANIVFEVGSASQGTRMVAYPAKNPPNLPYGDDQNPLRMVIAARCPTGATPQFKAKWKGFLIALDGVRNIDQAEEDKVGQKFEVSESTGCEDGDKTQPADLISFCTSPPRRVRNSRAEVDVEMANVDQTAAAILVCKVGDVYLPNMMSDHKGTYFNHVKAMMPQRDYKDKDGNLIAPHENYEKLREGTLVLAKVSLSFYTFKDRNPKFLDSKIYHVNVEKLTILDSGNGPAWDPEIPTLPGSAPSTPSTSRIRQRDAAVDDAFEDASPSKKGRSG